MQSQTAGSSVRNFYFHHARTVVVKDPNTENLTPKTRGVAAFYDAEAGTCPHCETDVPALCLECGACLVCCSCAGRPPVDPFPVAVEVT